MEKGKVLFIIIRRGGLTFTLYGAEIDRELYKVRTGQVPALDVIAIGY